MAAAVGDIGGNIRDWVLFAVGCYRAILDDIGWMQHWTLAYGCHSVLRAATQLTT